MAVERFGPVEGLAVVQKTTLALAEYYADKFNLDISDPEVSLITAALAFTRHKQLILFSEIEQDIFRRVVSSPDGEGYGRTLFRLTKAGAHKEVHREVDRLHARARSYSKELQQLAKDARTLDAEPPSH